MGFCQCGVLSCGVLSVWGFVLWGFVSVGFCPVGFCPGFMYCINILKLLLEAITFTISENMNTFLSVTEMLSCIYYFQIHETVETINQLKTSRDFFLSYSKEPQEFISNWLLSQTRDLKVYILYYTTIV